ncbi:hypothetical protein SEA_MORRIGAN_9 [Microbacterium phage Morrigan]|nr:hypothetical protein SEA_MORRIGAN_9 [Microbacterium phage Morrigan]
MSDTTPGAAPLEDQVQQGTAPEEVLQGEVDQSGPTRRTQAGYFAARRATKEAAAEVVAQNAKEAEAAKKKAQAKGFAVKGAKAFADKGKEVEAQLAERRASRAEAAKQ